MIGQLGPMIIIMLITAGAGALAAGSADMATITEEIGGGGTLARKEVQISDQGVVDSEESNIDTIKKSTVAHQ